MKKEIQKFLVFKFILIFSSQLSLGDSRDKLFYDAVRAEASGDLKRAIEIYSNISSDTNSANLHANLANLYFKIEDYARSALHFRKAIWIDPQNRDFSGNLSLALEKSGVSLDEISNLNQNFSPRSQTYWIILLTILLWSGIFYVIYNLRFPLKSNTALFVLAIWLASAVYVFSGFIKSRDESSRLNREIIALKSSTSAEDSTAGIPLRVFAGNGSTANTIVPPGTSLFLDLNDNGLPRVHKNQSGEKWFLVRSRYGANKGWIQRDEFDPILDLDL